VTALETQLFFARAVLLLALYAFIGAVGLVGWLDLRRSARRQAAAPAEPPGQVRLIVLDGATSDRPPGTWFGLEPVSAVGRDLDNDVVLADPTISGRHAVVSLRDGAWWVEDLASTNGTYVNGDRLPAEAPALLRSGDVVQVGAVRLRLVSPGL